MPYHTGNTKTIEEVRQVFNEGFEGDIAFTNQQFFQAFLPKVYINKVTVETGDADEFIFDVDLELRLPATGMPFFSDAVPEIKKFLKIYVLLIQEDKELFESSLNPGSNLVDPNIFVETKTLTNVTQTAENNITQKIFDDVSYKIFPFSVKFRQSLTPEQQKTFGVVTYSTFDFESDTFFSDSASSNMEESQRDALLILEEGNVSSTSYSYVTNTGNLWEGPFHVMEPDGSLMTGFVHDDERSIKISRIQNSVNKVQDFRVNQIFDTLSQAEGSFSEPYITVSGSDSKRVRVRSFENNIFNDLKKSLYKSESVLLPDKKQTHFSDFHMSKDEFGQCRFFFSINWKRMILENSLFGKFFVDKNEELNTLLNECKITSMKIERFRIKGSSEIGTGPVAGSSKLFEENEIFETVLISKDGTTGFKSIVHDSDNGQGGNNSIEEINVLSSYGNRLRHFTGRDVNVSNKTDGFYKYKISFEVKDSSKDIVIKQITEMKNIVDDIVKFYNNALYYTSPGVNINPSENAYVKGRDPARERGAPKPSNYNPKNNTFTDSYWNNIDVTPIENKISTFVNGYSFFDTNENDNLIKKSQVVDTLKSYLVKRELTTPYTMETALAIMENIVLRIQKYIDDTFTGSSVFRNLNNNAEKNNTPVGKIKTFLLENISDYFFEATGQQKRGFDFLGTVDNPSASTVDGIKRITTIEFNARVEDEKRIIFKNVDGFNTFFGSAGSQFVAPSTEISEKVFFSPAKILLPDEDEPIQGKNRSDYLRIYSNSLRKNINDKTIVEEVGVTRQITDSDKNILIDTMRRYLSSEFSVDIVMENNSNFDDTSRALIGGANAVNSFELQTVTSQPTEVTTPASETLFFLSRNLHLKDSKKFITSQDKDYSNSYYDLSNPNSQISRTLAPTRTNPSPLAQNNTAPNFGPDRGFLNTIENQNIIRNAPIQTKALLFYADKSGFIDDNLKLSYENLSDPSNYCYFIYRTQIINKVEMLVGYQERNGQILLRDPLWRSHNEVNEVLSGQDPVFCKSVPYNNDVLQIKRDNNFILPTYDNYFIIEETN